MANREPHGFAFNHVGGRRPSSVLSRQSRTKSTTNDARSSVRSSVRSSLFSGSKNRETSRKFGSGTSMDKTPSSGVFRSLFGRQVDKSPSSGDLWVNVDLHRSASVPLDSLSVSSTDWMVADTATAATPAATDCPDVDEPGHVAIVRRSNSVRPATRRPLPMRVPSVPNQLESRTETSTTDQVLVQDTDLWSRQVHSYNNARLSGDSGHVSYCSASSMLDEQEPSQMSFQEATTQQLHSADYHNWHRCTAQSSNGEVPMNSPDQLGFASNAISCSVSNSRPTYVSDRRQPSYCPAVSHHTQPSAGSSSAATDVRHNSPHRVMSSSTSDMQSTADSHSPQEPFPPPPVLQEWSQSLTRGTARTTDERLGTWPSNTTMTSSMPSIPHECGSSAAPGDTVQPTAEPSISTKDWLYSLHNKKNVPSFSKSTDQMYPYHISFNPAGNPHCLQGGGSGLVCGTASQSTLAGSNESFAVTEGSSRQSLSSVTSQERQNGRHDSLSSKKRRVRFELQPSTVQGVPDRRQQSRSRSDKRPQTVSDQTSSTDRELTAGDDVEGRTTSRASGSIFSKFRRVVVDGVGALFGLSKQKNNVDESSDTQLTCNGHLAASSFDDMTEMERLAAVADRVASERLHSAVLHGKLPTQNGYRSDSRSFGRPQPSFNDELESIEASFAGLNISPISAQPQQLASRNQTDFTSWCGNTSTSVTEDLCRLPSKACSSSVQFVPKSTTMPCLTGSTSAGIEPPSNCRKPSASSSMGKVVCIECQCGSGPVTQSQTTLPTTNSCGTSRLMESHRSGSVHSSENWHVQVNYHPHVEPSSVLKSAPQPATVCSHYQVQQCTSAPKQNIEVRRSTSSASTVHEKPQPPLKVFPRPSTTSFQEGLLPTSDVVEDFRIRRQAGTTSHGSQSGPMKATVPFVNNGSTSVSRARRPPPPPPTRNFAAADVCGLSSESDTEARRLTLQELTDLVDKELQANELLEMRSEVVETGQPLDLTAEYSTNISNHVDSNSASTSSKQSAVRSNDDVDAQLKSLGFDETIWNLQLEEILGGRATGEKKLGVSDDEEEDSASTLTDCSGSVITVTAMQDSRQSKSPVLSENDLLQPSNDIFDVVSGCGSVESIHSVDDQFSRSSRLSARGSSSSCSLPAISDVLEVRSVDGDTAHSRCSSTNIPVSRTCRQDIHGRWKLPAAFSFNQLVSGTTAAATCSPYNSNSSGIGSLVDSGSVPNSPL